MATTRSDLKFTVGADMSPFAATMRRVGMSAQATSAKVGRAFQTSAKAISGLAVTASKAGVAIAGIASSAALFKGVKLAADMESTAVAFKTLTGSAETANQVLGELRKLGAETPFEFPELADAGRKLIAFGEGADTVAETLRRVGDVSSGVQAPIGEIAELYGKARVQGRLFGEDINQLTGRGIPIIGELAKQFGVAESEVKKLVEEGKVGFPNLEKAFISLTSKGGTFFGMMEEQSKTFNGRISTLTDTVNESLRTIGEPIMRELIPHIEVLTEKLASVDFAPIARSIADAMPHIIDGAFRIADYAFQGFQYYKKITDLLGSVFAALFSSDFWDAANKRITAALLKPVGVFEQALHTAVSGGNLADVISSITAGDAGPLGKIAEGLESQAGKLSKVYEDSFAEIFNRPIKSLERFLEQNQKPEIFGPPKPSEAVPSPSPSPQYSGTQADGTTFGPSKDLMTPQIFGPSKDLMSRDVRAIRQMSAKSSEYAGAGFGGLADRYNMQIGKLRGKTPGSSNVFSEANRYGGEGGRWAGVSGSSVTGGLGEKRRLRTSGDDKDAKKNLSIQEQQVSHLESIERNISQSLSVN
jgi:tape measure domain-containing protein